MVFSNILIFLAGLLLLVKGSDFFVKSAASIAKRFGVSEFIIGLTLVALGTSVPELASSVAASLKNDSGLIIGNVIGSNIANICLIIGLAAAVSVIKTREDMLKRDGYIMLFAAALFIVLAYDSSISRIEALFFLLLYFAYVIFLLQMKPKFEGKYRFNDFIRYFWKFEYLTTIRSRVIITWKNRKKKVTPEERKKFLTLALAKDFLGLAAGGAAIVFGAKYLVEQSILFAEMLNVSSTFIGISVVAIGTSLPELMVSITAARKGFAEIALGNILGSNIANIFLILGVSGMIFPLSVIRATIAFSAPFMLFVSILLLLFIKSRWQIGRLKGLVFLFLYAAFIVLLFTRFAS